MSGLPLISFKPYYKLAVDPSRDEQIYNEISAGRIHADIQRDYDMDWRQVNAAFNRHHYLCSEREKAKILATRSNLLEQQRTSQQNPVEDEKFYSLIHTQGWKWTKVETEFQKSRQYVRSAIDRHMKWLEKENERELKDKKRLRDNVESDRANKGLRPFSVRLTPVLQAGQLENEEPKLKVGRRSAVEGPITEIALDMIRSNKFGYGTCGTLPKSKVGLVLGHAINEHKQITGDAKPVSSYLSNLFYKTNLENLTKGGGKRRNQRDIEAHADLGNAISWYLVCRTVLEGTPWEGVKVQDPRLLANVDAVTILTNARKNQPIVAIKGHKEWMRKFNRAASVPIDKSDGSNSKNQNYNGVLFNFNLKKNIVIFIVVNIITIYYYYLLLFTM